MFMPLNYMQVVCEECKSVTHINPGVRVESFELNCTCKKEEPKEPKKKVTRKKKVTNEN